MRPFLSCPGLDIRQIRSYAERIEACRSQLMTFLCLGRNGDRNTSIRRPPASLRIDRFWTADECICIFAGLYSELLALLELTSRKTSQIYRNEGISNRVRAATSINHSHAKLNLQSLITDQSKSHHPTQFPETISEDALRPRHPRSRGPKLRSHQRPRADRLRELPVHLRWQPLRRERYSGDVPFGAVLALILQRFGRMA
jgi:hypothetical protein